jgi:hypothetical protein
VTEDWDNPKTGRSSELAELMGTRSADRSRASGMHAASNRPDTCLHPIEQSASFFPCGVGAVHT